MDVTRDEFQRGFEVEVLDERASPAECQAGLREWGTLSCVLATVNEA
jgi:hypothetical protein